MFAASATRNPDAISRLSIQYSQVDTRSCSIQHDVVNFGLDAVNVCNRQHKPRCKVARREGPASRRWPRPPPIIQTRTSCSEFNDLKMTRFDELLTRHGQLLARGSTNRGVKSLEEKVPHRDVGRVRDPHPVAPKLAVRKRRCRDLPRKYENFQGFLSNSGSLSGRFVRRKL